MKHNPNYLIKNYISRTKKVQFDKTIIGSIKTMMTTKSITPIKVSFKLGISFQDAKAYLEYLVRKGYSSRLYNLTDKKFKVWYWKRKSKSKSKLIHKHNLKSR